MSNDDSLISMLKESFEADTRSVMAPPTLVSDVRSRLKRRRAASWTAAGAACLAVAVAVVLSAGSTARTDSASRRHTKPLHLSGYTFQVPADAVTTTTCLVGPDAWTNSVSAQPASIRSAA